MNSSWFQLRNLILERGIHMLRVTTGILEAKIADVKATENKMLENYIINDFIERQTDYALGSGLISDEPSLHSAKNHQNKRDTLTVFVYQEILDAELNFSRRKHIVSKTAGFDAKYLTDSSFGTVADILGVANTSQPVQATASISKGIYRTVNEYLKGTGFWAIAIPFQMTYYFGKKTTFFVTKLPSFEEIVLFNAKARKICTAEDYYTELAKDIIAGLPGT